MHRSTATQRFSLAGCPVVAALVVWSIFCPGRSYAAEPDCNKPLTILEIAQCNKELDCNAATTTFDIEQCAALSQSAIELRLEQMYREALDKMKEGSQAQERRKFIEAQTAWRTYREAHCGAVYESYQGGSLRGAAFSGCMKELAETRVFELNDYPHNQ